MTLHAFRAPLAAGAFACLFAMTSAAQTPAAAGPWAKVPPASTLCFQYTATNVEDPYYAKHEAAKAAIVADRDKQQAINAQIEEEFRNIDPMVQAQRMQQWMMSNPQEAMAFMKAAQDAGMQAPAAAQALGDRAQAREAEWNALKKSYDDARVKAYAPLQARRKAFEVKAGYPDSDPTLVPHFLPESIEDALVSEAITGEYDRAYKALCPQWWGVNGRFQAYLKKEKDWFATERTAELAKADAAKLQQYAMMSTPAATYRSIAAHEAALEYLDLAYKVYGERENVTGCERPQSCDGAYP